MLHSAEQIEAAVAELERELQVRNKCYDRWVEEGRIARIDARDRKARLTTAIEVLKSHMDTVAAFDEASKGQA